MSVAIVVPATREHPSLESFPLFEDVPLAELAPLARTARRQRFLPDQVICNRGDAADGLYVIASGVVRLSIDYSDGREVVVAVLASGDWFGDFGQAGAPGCAYNAVAMRPTDAFRLPVTALRAFLIAQPAVLLRLVDRLNRDLHEAHEQYADAHAHDVPTRLARRLLTIAQDHGIWREGALELTIPLRQHDLAALLGVSRESVNKAMATLRQQGLIQSAGARIRLVQPDRLARELSG
ncbi:MAG: Crp/Fnr family transcriptional regulator [Chloroflexi bacterium]|nr:Crp/Fnr family transcriptional regulator [Chloroflexota bacterium]